MKFSIKLPLAFGCTLLLMLCGAVYGMHTLNQSLPESITERIFDSR